MLFNSYEFICLFFPVVLLVYFLLGKKSSNKYALAWLSLASLFFYSYWNVKYLPLLLCSVLMNYVLAGLIIKAREGVAQTRNKILFFLSLAANIGLLGWYKYADFFIKNLNYVLSADYPLLHIILPLGISFFTITQLLYLYDCYHGITKEHSFLRYVLFVTFFPHLLAGPILYHRQMMSQFADDSLPRVNWDNMASGVMLFTIGLAKKVLIADSFIAYVNYGFANPGELTVLQGWLTAICYMLQLYFDFSGYSDMAVGLSRMMNITIPINFNSPYKAASLINFWQRWHISLTNAITACVYMPLVRSFKKPTVYNTAFAAFVAFFLVGIWHGAGWHYVAFALMHAAGMAVNHIWKHYRLWCPKPLGHVLTLLYVLVAMVFFRAGSLGEAFLFLKSMAGLGAAGTASLASGFMGGADFVMFSLQATIHFPAFLFLLGILLVFLAPNSNQIMEKADFSGRYLLLTLALLGLAMFQLGGTTDFLYFQF